MVRAGLSQRPCPFSCVTAPMTNSIAIVLALLILGAIAADVMLYGTEHLIFLGKKFADLLEWLAFWR